MFDGVQFHKLQRANGAELKSIFEKYADIDDSDGKRYMSPKNFLVDYVGLPLECEETVKLLSSAIDTTGDGRISYTEFVAFEALLCMPDSLFRVAYQVFYDLFYLIQTLAPTIDFGRLGKFTVDLTGELSVKFIRLQRNQSVFSFSIKLVMVKLVLKSASSFYLALTFRPMPTLSPVSTGNATTSSFTLAPISSMHWIMTSSPNSFRASSTSTPSRHSGPIARSSTVTFHLQLSPILCAKFVPISWLSGLKSTS